MAFSVALPSARDKSMNSMPSEQKFIVIQGVSEWEPKMEGRRTFDSREHLCLGKAIVRPNEVAFFAHASPH
jgi:hypothetical protein